MNTRRRSAIAVCGIGGLLVVGGVILWQSHRAEEAEREKIRNIHQHAYAEIGAISLDSERKLFDIKDRAKSSGTITDEEISYCIHVFDQGPIRSTPLAWNALAIDTSDTIARSAVFTPHQEELIDGFSRDLVSHGKDSPGCEIAGLILVRRCLTPNRMRLYDEFVSSPDKSVQTVALRMKNAERG
jgi:hypothetical protein